MYDKKKIEKTLEESIEIEGSTIVFEDVYKVSEMLDNSPYQQLSLLVSYKLPKDSLEKKGKDEEELLDVFNHFLGKLNEERRSKSILYSDTHFISNLVRLGEGEAAFRHSNPQGLADFVNSYLEELGVDDCSVERIEPKKERSIAQESNRIEHDLF